MLQNLNYSMILQSLDLNLSLKWTINHLWVNYWALTATAAATTTTTTTMAYQWILPSCRRMYAEKRASAVSESWTSARHLTNSKIWLTRFISAESPVVRKASIGSIVSKKSTAFCPTSKYRLIRIIANSNAPKKKWKNPDWKFCWYPNIWLLKHVTTANRKTISPQSWTSTDFFTWWEGKILQWGKTHTIYQKIPSILNVSGLDKNFTM